MRAQRFRGTSLVRKILRFAVFTLVGLVVLAIALLIVFHYEFFPTPPKPNFPPPRNQAEANRQDLEYLKHLTKLDRSFSPQAKAAFQQLVDRLIAQAAGQDRAGLEMGVARAEALADNGHTNETDAGRDLNYFPLQFDWFAEGLFVVKAAPAQADLLGAQVIAEGGQTSAALTQELHPYIGGPTNLRQTLAINFLQSPQALHAAGLLPSPDEASFTFQLHDGRRFERALAAQPAGLVSGSRWPERSLSPVPIQGDTRKWVHVLDTLSQLPPYLQNPNQAYWDMYLDDAIYIQINQVRNRGDVPLKVYLANLLDKISERNPRFAIVDLRFNSGGDYTLTDAFTEHLPQRIRSDGKIFIVTSANTFSAAIVTAARLKYYAGARGYIVGERIGDREQHWGEARDMMLPNSKIVVDYATGYHDWEHGCHSLTNCYWVNFFLGVPAGNLSPGIPAPLRFADYMAGRDPALEAIRSEIRR